MTLTGLDDRMTLLLCSEDAAVDATTDHFQLIGFEVRERNGTQGLDDFVFEDWQLFSAVQSFDDFTGPWQCRCRSCFLRRFLSSRCFWSNLSAGSCEDVGVEICLNTDRSETLRLNVRASRPFVPVFRELVQQTRRFEFNLVSRCEFGREGWFVGDGFPVDFLP
ncbi:hypothetical protein D3C71_1681690 [compost metagenome]